MKSILRGFIVSTFVLGVLTGASIAQGQADSRSAARLGELTAAVTQRIESKQKGRFDSTFRRIASERKLLLSRLVETDSAEALRLTLGEGSLARIPSEFAELFEKRNEFKGELVVEAECEENNFRMRRYLKSGDSSKELFLDADPATEMKTGDQITTVGYDIDNKILASAGQATVTTAAASSATTGEKRVLVILVNFQDKQTQPFTVEQARDVTFNQTSNYMRENSYAQTWLTGDVYGWFTIPVSSTSCDRAAIANYAQQAATNAGVALSSYDHQVYAFPANACNWGGSGSLGANPGQVWINNYYTVNSVAHELGHNFGLYHARSLDCGSQTLGDICTTNEYGDVYDVMGGGAAAHINLFQKERLGWVNYGSSPPIQSVTSSGTYWVEAYETSAGGTKGLKILKSTDPGTGTRTWYYVERRTPYGFDSYIANIVNMVNGVVIHTGSESTGQDGYILDMTPETASWYDPALIAGQSFTDEGIGMRITTLSADSTGAWVQVELARQACFRSNPTVSVTPGQSNWMSAGSSFTYQVSVTNNNSGGCESEAFKLSMNMPSGLTGTLSTPLLFLANGASGMATVNATSSANTADGTYNFDVTAANASNSSVASSGKASYVLVSGLAVSVTSGAAKYSRSQTASVSATIKAAGAPAGSASVTFTMTKPNGAIMTQTVMTGSDGRATFSYKFDRKRDPTGAYTVRAVANAKGYFGQASTGFSVTK